MKAKINNLKRQMYLQNGLDPDKEMAIEAWNEVRLKLKDSVEVKVLDNFFKQ